MAKKILISLFALSLVGIGCKKKDRLSANSYDLVIIPPVTTVKAGEATPFVVQGLAPSETVAVEPTWSSSPVDTTNVHINPPVGSEVSITFDIPYLNYTISAEFQDKTATSQVHVATELPSGFPPMNPSAIYTDQGIPPGAALNPGGFIVLNEQTGSDAPEGTKYMRATEVVQGGWWNVDLGDGTMNLDDYPGGTLRFSIRKSRVLAGTPTTGGTEFLRVEMGRTGFPNEGATTNVPGWTGFTNTSVAYPDWQHVSIPLSRFYSGTGVVNIPFVFVKVSAGASMTIDIDNVRLVK